ASALAATATRTRWPRCRACPPRPGTASTARVPPPPLAGRRCPAARPPPPAAPAAPLRPARRAPSASRAARPVAPPRPPPPAARSGAALAEKAPEALLGSRQVPGPRESVGDHEADVVAGALVLAARVAQADDQPVNGCAATGDAHRCAVAGRRASLPEARPAG